MLSVRDRLYVREVRRDYRGTMWMRFDIQCLSGPNYSFEERREFRAGCHLATTRVRQNERRAELADKLDAALAHQRSLDKQPTGQRTRT